MTRTRSASGRWAGSGPAVTGPEPGLARPELGGQGDADAQDAAVHHFDRLDVHLVPTALFTDAYREHLVKQIRDQTRIPDIAILVVDEIDVKIAGKHRLLRSDVSAQIAQ